MVDTSLTDLKYPTDYNLKKLMLCQSDGTPVLDLKPYMVEFNYFEDIFNNTVSGKIVISDGGGNFDVMVGYEKLLIEFVSATGGTPISGKFFIYSLSDRHYDKNMNFENYIINFCDEDYILSKKYRTCKSYKKTTISNIITDILSNLFKTPNKLDIQSTVGSYDLILPNRKIFETINWLANYAMPGGNTPGADMLFFQTYQGYKFKSLQTLYKQNPVCTYYYSAKNISSSGIKELNYYNIYKLEILSNIDTLKGTEKGAFNNRLISFDPLLRQKYTKDFDYENYFNTATHLNDEGVIDVNDVEVGPDQDQDTVYTDRFGKKLNELPAKDDVLQAGTMKLMMSNKSQLEASYISKNNTFNAVQNDINIDTYLPNRISQIQLATYIKIKITVPGNTALTAGQVVKVYIQDTEIEQNQFKSDDVYLSGNYLITAVRHIIDGSLYMTVVELCKDTRIKQLENN